MTAGLPSSAPGPGAAGPADVLDRFDRARRGPAPVRIEDFLPALAAHDPARRHLLLELIKIDLECGWHQAKTGAHESVPRLNTVRRESC